MFKFQKYIHPTSYYNLLHRVRKPILVDIENFTRMNGSIISDADSYRTNQAIRSDLAFQALQKGAIPSHDSSIVDLQKEQVDNLSDNYRFIKRYYGIIRTLYVLIIRILSLNNPAKELAAFISTWNQKKIDVFKLHVSNANFNSFNSELLQRQPLVSIVIPTLNRYRYLKDVLLDLERQTYTNFEVLVCDQTEPLNKEFYYGWKLKITLLPQAEKALWLARNRCIQSALGNYILLFDDDSRVEPDWIEQHIKCLDYFNAHISAGVTHTLVGHGLSPKEDYFHLSEVFDTGNAMVKREVFEKVGLFDRQFEKQRMGDGEFGLRALLGGFPSISNPYAKRIHLKVETGGLRQVGSWDALRPQKLLAPRPIPSVLYYIRKYYGNTNAVLYIIQNVPFSFIPYSLKKSKTLKIISLTLLPLALPLIIWVVCRSWSASSAKLRQGGIIPTLS